MTNPYPFSVNPVFVYGSLRSGTTLLRLMLDAHPGISIPGEKDCLFDHLHPDPAHPTGWRYNRQAMLLDRMFRATGLTLYENADGLELLDRFLVDLQARGAGALGISIHRNICLITHLMPRAKLIHLLRDPRDVAYSSMRMGWAGTGWHAAEHWLVTETAWDNAAIKAPPENVLTLHYEDLLADTKAQLQRLTTLFGVGYDPVMLDYPSHSTYGPPDKSLALQWRKSMPRSEIDLVEARLGSLMVTRNYLPTRAVRAPGKLKLTYLGLRNKWRIWRIGVSRYGFGLYFGEKLTRWVGLRDLHRQLKLRKDARTTELLK